jgi:hypothetical protein
LFQNEHVTYLPFNIGEARFLHPQADFLPFYDWLKHRLGLRATHSDLRIRKGRSGRTRLWFVHNLGDRPAEFPLAGARNLFTTRRAEIGPDEWAVLIIP